MSTHFTRRDVTRLAAAATLAASCTTRGAAQPVQESGQAMHAIRHPVIPAPVRFDGDRGEFTFRSGTVTAYTNTDVAPIVERFCLEVTRRMGLRILPMAGNLGSNEPFVRIDLSKGANSKRSPHRWVSRPRGTMLQTNDTR
jgi:predicted small secreted protein